MKIIQPPREQVPFTFTVYVCQVVARLMDRCAVEHKSGCEPCSKRMGVLHECG